MFIRTHGAMVFTVVYQMLFLVPFIATLTVFLSSRVFSPMLSENAEPFTCLRKHFADDILAFNFALVDVLGSCFFFI